MNCIFTLKLFLYIIILQKCFGVIIVKKVKSLTACILAIAMVWLLLIPSFAAKTQYQRLIEYGYPKEYVDSLSDEMISQICNIIGNDTIIKVEETEAILNETGDIDTCGAIPQSYMNFKGYAGTICKKGTNIITGVLVSVSWEWIGSKPTVRKQDAIAINWDSSVFNYVADSFYAQSFYKQSGTSNWLQYKEWTNLSEAVQGGVGFFTQLAYSTQHVYNNKGAAAFVIQPNSSMIEGSAYSSSINYNYVHDRTPLVNGSIGFGIQGASVSIKASSLTSDSTATTANVSYSR